MVFCFSGLSKFWESARLVVVYAALSMLLPSELWVQHAVVLKAAFGVVMVAAAQQPHCRDFQWVDPEVDGRLED